MRSWEIRTRRNDSADFNVALFKWQRQAYRFVIDWFLDDPGLLSISLIDEAGHADPLTLERVTQAA